MNIDVFKVGIFNAKAFVNRNNRKTNTSVYVFTFDVLCRSIKEINKSSNVFALYVSYIELRNAALFVGVADIL